MVDDSPEGGFMLSRTSEYALRAVVYLAQHVDVWPIPGRRIADELDIPRKYLSSILADLVRAGVLEATPGKSGGFRMVRPPERVRLLEVLAPFESVLTDRRACPFGNAVCSDDHPCAGHSRWRVVRQAYEDFLQESSVYDVSAPRNGRRSTSRKKGTRR
jgi:Rrf2 family protein